MQSGNIDAIMSSPYEQTSSLKELQVYFSQSKTSKDIKEIFVPGEDGQDPHSILIEGAPGIGKTVLSKEISVQWANGQLLINAILVFLIFLRDPLAQKIESLKDLVKYYYRFDESSDTIASSCADYLLQSNGDRVTFIFDGYDEYPENLQQNGFISDILWCRRLSERRLVLTSRPHASAHLHQLFERRVDILGFTKEDRQNYINFSLENKEADITPLTEYLNNHLTISSLCFIPFNMTMLLWLYKQGIVLPCSSTELYNYFICHTICHHLAKNHVFIDNILDLSHFEQPYKKVIQQLSFLSYEALSKSQLTFTLDEVKAVCPQIDKIPGAINCFGLLQAVQYPGIMRMTTKLSFIHFSLQEFLAAYHITCLPYQEELSVLKEKFMSDVHANMFSIYVGITKGMRPAFRNYLKYGTSEGLEQVVIELSRSEPFESGVAISSEILQDKHMCLRLFKCFREAGDKSICSQFCNAFCSSNDSIKLLFNHGLYMSPLSPSDVECLGSVLANKKEWQNFSLSLSDISIEVLHQLLATNTPTIHRISLHLSSNNTLSSNLVTKIAVMCKTTKLSVIGTFCTATIVTSLQDNRFLEMLYLYIQRTEVLNEQSLQGFKYSNSLQHLAIIGHFSCTEQCQTIGQSIKRLNRNIEIHIFQIVTDDYGAFLRTERKFVYVPVYM